MQRLRPATANMLSSIGFPYDPPGEVGENCQEVVKYPLASAVTDTDLYTEAGKIHRFISSGTNNH